VTRKSNPKPSADEREHQLKPKDLKPDSSEIK
jgi:hypothetical protein